MTNIGEHENEMFGSNQPLEQLLVTFQLLTYNYSSSSQKKMEIELTTFAAPIHSKLLVKKVVAKRWMHDKGITETDSQMQHLKFSSNESILCDGMHTVVLNQLSTQSYPLTSLLTSGDLVQMEMFFFFDSVRPNYCEEELEAKRRVKL